MSDNTHIILAEARAIQAEIVRLQAELKVRTTALAASVGDAPGKHTTSNGTFTVSENNTYDEEAMRAALLPGQVRRCSKMRLDKAMVKQEAWAAAINSSGLLPGTPSKRVAKP